MYKYGYANQMVHRALNLSNITLLHLLSGTLLKAATINSQLQNQLICLIRSFSHLPVQYLEIDA